MTTAFGGAQSTKTPTFTKEWTAIPLAETPLAITAHNGELWVVGQKETIAVSKDGGRSWEIRHQSAAGEMLFSLAFASDSIIYATGSGHTWLTSTDGGAHWNLSNDLKLSWSEAAFSAGGFGIAADADAWGTTSNGGKKWQMYGLQLAADALSPPTKPGGKLPKTAILHGLNRRILSVSVLDDKRAAVLFAAEDGQQPWASTTDGGKTWQQSGLDQVMTLTGMRAAESKFWVYGQSKADNSPVAMTSADTANWDNAPAPLLPYSSCTDQGCLAPGGWAQIAGGQTTLWQLPAPLAGVSPTSWAAGKDTFCEVGDDHLYCTLTQDKWTAMPAALAEVDYRTLNATAWVPPELPSDNHQGVVLVRMLLGADGRPESLQVMGAEWADLAEAVVKGIKPWHFDPVKVNRQPVAAVVTIPYLAVASGEVKMVHPGMPSASNTCCEP